MYNRRLCRGNSVLPLIFLKLPYAFGISYHCGVLFGYGAFASKTYVAAAMQNSLEFVPVAQATAAGPRADLLPILPSQSSSKQKVTPSGNRRLHPDSPLLSVH